MRRFVMALAAVMAVGAVAQAQVQVVREPDKVVPKRHTILDFTPVLVDGGVEKPSDGFFTGKPNVSFPSLIKLRASFKTELTKSADQL